jgi:hypothetical protein
VNRARPDDGTPGSDTAARASNHARANRSGGKRHKSRVMEGYSNRHGRRRRRREKSDGDQRAARQTEAIFLGRTWNNCSE